MKKTLLSSLLCWALLSITSQLFAQGATEEYYGWPANYGGVMLQGFYWDSYDETNWQSLTNQADELSKSFELIWVPNSAKTSTTNYNSMGYDPLYWLDHNSCFGTDQQLRTMINTFKDKGTGIIEDVVINHKKGVTDWCDFPTETWEGHGTMEWSLADICKNDDGGYTLSQGHNVSGNYDTGDDFSGFRDLDHTSENVQKNVKLYLKYLLNDLGYAGFRYDMVKGYSAYYTKMYNLDSEPTFSVGEYFDGKDAVYNWVNGTEKTSAAFDFGLKFSINNTFGQGNFDLADKGMAADVHGYSRYAVTFVENHDTYRDNNRLYSNILAANAFILAMPGTPCIFWPHWTAYKNEIKRMIKARKAAGITNTSEIIFQSNWDYNAYVIKVKGTDNKEVLMISGYAQNFDTTGYKAVSVGNSENPNYAFFVSNNVDLGYLLAEPQVSMPANAYYPSIATTLSATMDGATIVYTTDGTEPTANSNPFTGSIDLNFTETTTLKAGIIVDGDVMNIKTFKYTITPEAGRIYARSANNRAMYFYAYDGSYKPNGDWGEGNKVTNTEVINGDTWYYFDYDLTTHPNLNLIVRDSNDDNCYRWPLEGDDVKVSSYADTPFIYLRNNNTPEFYTREQVEDLSAKRIYARSANGSQIYLYSYDGDNENYRPNGEWGNDNLIESTTVIDGTTWYFDDYNVLTYPNMRLIVRDANGNRYPAHEQPGIVIREHADEPFILLNGNSLVYSSEDDIIHIPYLIGPAVGVDFDQTDDAIEMTWDEDESCWKYTGQFNKNGFLRIIVNKDYKRNWSEETTQTSTDGKLYNTLQYNENGNGTENGCGGSRIQFTAESGTYTMRFYTGTPNYTLGRTLKLRNMTYIANPEGVKYGEIAANTRTINGTLYKSGTSWADDVAYQTPDDIDVFVVSGLETDSEGNTYKVVLSPLTDGIIPANTGVLLFSQSLPATETDKYLTVEAVGASNSSVSYLGTNLLSPVVEPAFIPGTVTNNNNEVTYRNFMFGFYCVGYDANNPPTVGEYSYTLGFWRSSLSADANPSDNLSDAHMAYLNLSPEQYGDTTYGEFDANPSTSPFIHFAFDDEDGIANIRTTSVTDDLYYSLEGVRIGKPSKKGIYIHNGKKVVVR